MKLVIPPVIKLGALDIDIVFSQKIVDAASCRAISSLEKQLIRLDKELKPALQFVALYHEVEHLAEELAGYTTAEAILTSRANFVVQAILSLGIEPDFSQIPEEE